MFDPPTTGHEMRLNGESYPELTPSGRAFLQATVRLEPITRVGIPLEFPRKIIEDEKLETVTVAAVGRFLGDDEFQLCFPDPEFVEHRHRRPEEFSSTATNRLVLITMKRLR